MAACVPFFQQLERGIIVHLAHCRTAADGANPTGAVLLKGGFLSFASDMPAGNDQSLTKGVGANIPCRHVVTHADRIPDVTPSDVVMDARVHEVHLAAINDARTRPTKTAKEAAATAYGVLWEKNSEFIEGCTCDCPRQWGQV